MRAGSLIRADWTRLETETDMRVNYEQDDATFSAAGYCIQRWRGVAWNVLGWETEPDGDTEWSGNETRTGRIVCRMIGDDRDFTFDPDDVEAIPGEDFCSVCGQIGCFHDGLDREGSGGSGAG